MIYNDYIPFKGYIAINLFTLIFAREEYRPLLDSNPYFKDLVLNHERIHSAQQKELLFIPFYLLYFIEFIVKLIKYRNWNDAYRNISFEVEAKKNESNKDYLSKRKPFSMWRK